jgi:hypothetical protein
MTHASTHHDTMIRGAWVHGNRGAWGMGARVHIYRGARNHGNTEPWGNGNTEPWEHGIRAKGGAWGTFGPSGT